MNNNSNNLYGKVPYAGQEQPQNSQQNINANPSANVATNVPLTPEDFNEVFNSMSQKDIIQSDNLKEQREIIKERFQDSKVLREQQEVLIKRIEELENAQAQGSYASINPNNDYVNKLTSIENELTSIRRKEQEAKMIPVLNLFREFGVTKNEVSGTFDAIKKEYGVDLMATPNLQLAQFALSNLYSSEPNSVPNGGIPNQNQMDSHSQAEADFQLKKQQALIDIENYAQAKKIKR